MARPTEGKTTSESLNHPNTLYILILVEEHDGFRGPDGHFQPVEQVMPMDEAFVGAFRREPHSPAPPTPPPKDASNGIQTDAFPKSPVSSSQLSNMSAVDRSNALRVARMHPHLQFMVGPLLRYDTVDEQGIWNGCVLIVSTCQLVPLCYYIWYIRLIAADSGSTYEPHPTLTYEWDPDRAIPKQRMRTQTGTSFSLGPHPADPHSTIISPTNGEAKTAPLAQKEQVPGHEIWVYVGKGGYVDITSFRYTLN